MCTVCFTIKFCFTCGKSNLYANAMEFIWQKVSLVNGWGNFKYIHAWQQEAIMHELQNKKQNLFEPNLTWGLPEIRKNFDIGSLQLLEYQVVVSFDNLNSKYN